MKLNHWMNGKSQKMKNNFILLRDIIVILIAIISFSIIFVINFVPLYYWFVSKFDLASLIHISKHELMMNYINLLKYLNFFWITKWDRTIKASYTGLIHFEEVKILVEINNIIGIIFILLSYFIIRKRIKNKTLWQFIIPLKLISSGLLIFFSIVFIYFYQLFILFHKLIFANNYWIFNPTTDPIIKVLPIDFFEASFILIVLIAYLFGLILYFKCRDELKKLSTGS